MLGYSLAYEATRDEAIRELIREDVVELVEQLMKTETRTWRIEGLDIGFPLMADLQMQYLVYTDLETASGEPEIHLDLDNLDDSDIYGYQEFHPWFYNEVADQVALLSWLPDVPRSGSAIMLASFFQVALQVTDGVKAYSARRVAIEDHYLKNFDGWWTSAENPLGYLMDGCGDSYYGRNIRFEPMYNLARLEADPARGARIEIDVLQDIMWLDVEDHKNAFFAFIYASQHPNPASVQSVIDDHVLQLQGFRTAPLVRDPIDLTAIYAEDPSCPGNADVAIDVADRANDGFIWQRHPWKLVDAGSSVELTSGVDYLVAYWLARRHGFMADDTPDACLKWRPL